MATIAEGVMRERDLQFTLTMAMAAVAFVAICMAFWANNRTPPEPTLSTVIRDAAMLSDDDKRRLLDNFNYLTGAEDEDADDRGSPTGSALASKRGRPLEAPDDRQAEEGDQVRG